MARFGNTRTLGALIVAVLGLVSVSAAAKTNPPKNGRYWVWKQTIGAEAITIQQPASGGRRLWMEIINIHCTVAADVDLESNGTAATATTMTVLAVMPDFTPTATAWSGSDVGVGRKIDEFNVAAGDPGLSVNVEGLYMQGSSTATNYTIRSDCTGTGSYYIRWREE